VAKKAAAQYEPAVTNIVAPANLNPKPPIQMDTLRSAIESLKKYDSHSYIAGPCLLVIHDDRIYTTYCEHCQRDLHQYVHIPFTMFDICSLPVLPKGGGVCVCCFQLEGQPLPSYCTTFPFDGLCGPCCDAAADLLYGLVEKSMLLRAIMPAELADIITMMILNFFPLSQN
jgi:hypothetical protein